MQQKYGEIRDALEVFLLMVVIVTLAILIPKMETVNSFAESRRARELHGWYYYADGQRVETELPAVLSPDENGSLVLYNDSISQMEIGLMLGTKAAEYNLRMYMGDMLLYRYSDDVFPRNNQMKGKLICAGMLPQEIQEGTLRLEYTLEEDSEIPVVYIGGNTELIKLVCSESIPMLVIVFAMLFGSFLAFTVGLYMNWLRIPDPRFVDVAMFFLISALWYLSDSTLAWIFVSQKALITMVSFYAFMMMAVPMVHFIRNTVGMGKYKILDVFLFLFYLNALVQGILVLSHVYTMIQMLFVTHILLVGGVMTCIVTLILEYRRNARRGIYTVLMAFAALGASGVLAILLYWAWEITCYDLIFEIGILIFGVMILNETVLTVVRNFRDQTELKIYQRLALEDQLTGLGNRRAFEEDLAELQNQMGTGENAALVFADVNHLKKINEEFGHNTGDELIIAAARSIEHVFGRVGKCYRISGNEFCVILKDPTDVESELFPALDREIENFSHDSRLPLFLARGVSYLRRPDGSVKSMSEWKYEADRNMYGHKGGENRT